MLHGSYEINKLKHGSANRLKWTVSLTVIGKAEVFVRRHFAVIKFAEIYLSGGVILQYETHKFKCNTVVGERYAQYYLYIGISCAN